MAKKLLVEKLAPKYELYSQWLEEEHELIVPADHLQIALRHYGSFQKSDINKAANAERAEARATEKAETTKTKRTTKKSKVTDDEDDEDEDGEPAPAPKKAPAAKKGRGGKAQF
jgi:hypothetical protein